MDYSLVLLGLCALFVFCYIINIILKRNYDEKKYEEDMKKYNKKRVLIDLYLIEQQRICNNFKRMWG